MKMPRGSQEIIRYSLVRTEESRNFSLCKHGAKLLRSRKTSDTPKTCSNIVDAEGAVH